MTRPLRSLSVSSTRSRGTRRRSAQRGMALLETIIFFFAVMLIWVAGRYFMIRWTAVHQAHRAVQRATLAAAYDLDAERGGTLEGKQRLVIEPPRVRPKPILEPVPASEKRLANQRDAHITVDARAHDASDPPRREPDGQPVTWAREQRFEVPRASVLAPPLARDVPAAALEAYDAAVADSVRGKERLLEWR